MTSKKQILKALAIVGVIVFVLGTIKFCQIRAAMSNHFQMPPVAVTSIILKETPWQKNISAVGSLESPAGTTLSTETAGRVQSINFESGAQVTAGTVLLELDNQVEKANLTAAQADREEAARSFERAKVLRTSNTIPQSEFDDARAKAQSTEANVQSLDAMVKRRMIIAPYNGVLGIRQVTLGQYVESGVNVVALQSLDPLFVNFALPQNDLMNVKTAQDIEVTLDAFPGEKFIGKVTAIDSQVDSNTRTIAVQGTLSNPKALLRPGMFVRVTIALSQVENVIAIPASSISYAPYGDTVYVIETMKNDKGVEYRGVRPQIVKLGEHRGDQAVVLSGLTANQEIVSSGTFKVHPGAAVAVDNALQPGNTQNPQPEDQ